jgi:hypothetical protein
MPTFRMSDTSDFGSGAADVDGSGGTLDAKLKRRR